MSVDVCRERFLTELGQLRGRFPCDAVLIGSYEAVVDGGDDVVFGLLIELVGPAAPVCADELWECVSGFLRDRRRDGVVQRTDPVQKPCARAVFAVHAAVGTSGYPAVIECGCGRGRSDTSTVRRRCVVGGSRCGGSPVTGVGSRRTGCTRCSVRGIRAGTPGAVLTREGLAATRYPVQRSAI